MAKAGELFVTVGAKITDFEKKMGTVSKKLKTVGDKMKNTGKTLSTHLTAPLTALGGTAMAAADQIDKAYRNIKVGTGATGEALEGLKESFNNVFAEVPDSADAVSNALANLNTYTGATGKTLEALTKSVLDASRMLGEDGVANSQAFGQALKQWQIPAEEGINHLDHLFKLTQDYGIGLGELNNKLAAYGSVLNNAGFSMAEAAELMASLESNGISVSRVMPGLNRAFRNWAAEGKNSREELGKVIDQIRNAEDSQKALAIASEVFGAQGAQRITTAIRNGAIPAFEELGDALESSKGLISETTEETRTIGERFAILKNQTTQALEPLGSILIDLAEKALPPLTNAVTRLAEWFQNLSPSIQMTIVAFGGLLAVIGPTLVILGSVVGAIGNLIPVITNVFGWFTKLTPVIKGVGVALRFLALNPVGLAITAIAGLIAIAISVWKNWDSIKPKLIAVWETVRNALGEAWDWIKSKAEWLGDTLSNIWTNIKIWVIDRVTGMVSTVVDKFQSFVSDVRDKFNQVKERILNPIAEARDKIKEIVDKIKSFFDGLKLEIPKPKLPKLPRFSISGKFSLNPPSVPKISVDWFAKGGIVDGARLIGVGEAGPEAIIPLRGQAMQPFADAIAEKIAASNMSNGRGLQNQYRPIVIHNHFGTVIADKQGLKKLERMLESIRIDEQGRKGVATT